MWRPDVIRETRCQDVGYFILFAAMKLGNLDDEIENEELDVLTRQEQQAARAREEWAPARTEAPAREEWAPARTEAPAEG